MHFAIPMVWNETKDHVNNCYFCMVYVVGYNATVKKDIVYPNIPSAIRPVVHSKSLPFPVLPVNLEDVSDNTESNTENECEPNLEEYTLEDKSVSKLFNQSELNNLTCDLKLSKKLI